MPERKPEVLFTKRINRIHQRDNVFYCLECDRAWEWSREEKKPVYWTRDVIPYYGKPKKICQECMEKKET